MDILNQIKHLIEKHKKGYVWKNDDEVIDEILLKISQYRNASKKSRSTI